MLSKDIEVDLFYPVANAQIVRIQDKDNIIDRNFNITWVEDLPGQNEIVDGDWFQRRSGKWNIYF